MQFKLSANADYYNTSVLQIRYTQSQISGLAIKQVKTWFWTSALNTFTLAKEVFEALEHVYTDPDPKHTVTTKFQKLYQNNLTFYAF